MLKLLSAVGSLLSFRVRSRRTLGLERVSLRHQKTVLRRHRPLPTIATKVARPELFAVTAPAPPSRCRACRGPPLRCSDAGVPRTDAGRPRRASAAPASIADHQQPWPSSATGVTDSMAEWLIAQTRQSTLTMSVGLCRGKIASFKPPHQGVFIDIFPISE